MTCYFTIVVALAKTAADNLARVRDAMGAGATAAEDDELDEEALAAEPPAANGMSMAAVTRSTERHKLLVGILDL